MSCKVSEICGGCSYRHLDEASYQKLKIENFKRILSGIKSDSYRFNSPIFISDGSRRRASFAFRCNKKGLVLGFNRAASDEIIDVK